MNKSILSSLEESGILVSDGAWGTFLVKKGLSPRDAAIAAKDAGADIIGTNCGNGMWCMQDIAGEMRKAVSSLPIIVQANAGLPVLKDGKDCFPDSPDDMSAYVSQLLNAGAKIIGGCCGTTPAHIKAVKKGELNWIANN